MERRRRQGQSLLWASDNEKLCAPPIFGEFSDGDGFNGRPPSAVILLEVWYKGFEGRECWCHRNAQLIDGQNIAGDESFKVIKDIRFPDSKVYNGICTCLKEHYQVSMQIRCTIWYEFIVTSLDGTRSFCGVFIIRSALHFVYIKVPVRISVDIMCSTRLVSHLNPYRLLTAETKETRGCGRP